MSDTPSTSRSAFVAIVLVAITGVLLMGALTFLAGPLGFFLAIGLFVVPVGVAYLAQWRRTRR